MVPWIDRAKLEFPPVERALAYPNGLLAAGGDLKPERLLLAYRQGIFPWFDNHQPVLWWSPNPRAVLFPEKIKISRSLNKTLKKAKFSLTVNKHFATVVRYCAAPREDSRGTWLTRTMIEAYCLLFEKGFAQSIETWYEGELVGGLYGVVLGKVFFGESMFSRVNDASKVALVHLAAQPFALIDCQVPSPHLSSLGSEEIPRKQFIELLDQWCDQPNLSVSHDTF